MLRSVKIVLLAISVILKINCCYFLRDHAQFLIIQIGDLALENVLLFTYRDITNKIHDHILVFDKLRLKNQFKF